MSATVNASITDSDVAAENGGVVVKVDEDSQYAGDHVELTGWTLNVANRSTRLVRDVSGFDTWIGYDASSIPERFVEKRSHQSKCGKIPYQLGCGRKL